MSGLRRRRRSISNSPDENILAASLVEENGVLRWYDGVPAREEAPQRSRRARRAAGPPPLSGPDGRSDQGISKAPAQQGRCRHRRDRHAPQFRDRRLAAVTPPAIAGRTTKNSSIDSDDVHGPFNGRTLLLVHGTFSNAVNMVCEFEATTDGQAFLDAALNGPNKYNQVLVFEHATLAVSPVLNALELGRAFSGASGQVDVIAHSRGGLIVRWWLEAFGGCARRQDARRLCGLAAIRHLAGRARQAPARAEPDFQYRDLCREDAKSRRWRQSVPLGRRQAGRGGDDRHRHACQDTPCSTGLSRSFPGLFGQSRISNNYELNLLRLGPCTTQPRLFRRQVELRDA